MGFIDDVSKAVSQSIDRAKFEAEKFQRVNRIQSELNDFKRKLDSQMIEIGNRAYDLHRAGKISSPSIAELVKTIDDLRAKLVLKEEELKSVQADMFVEPEQPVNVPLPNQSQPQSQSQSQPAQDDTPPYPQQTIVLPQSKSCPVCKFEMPMHAVFCPNCGYRVGQ